MTGPLPAIVDFDGTLVDLGLDWETLKRDLGLGSVSEEFDSRYHGPLRDAEMAHLRGAPVNEALVDALSHGGPFAILTNNSSETVAAFLDAHPALRERCVLVVGREQLPDSKEDWHAWLGGVTACLRALGVAQGERWRYIGDSPYELVHARRARAVVTAVRRWGPAAEGLGA